MQLSQASDEVRLETIVGLLARPRLHVDDEIDRRARDVAMVAKDLPDDSLDPVARDGVSELLRGGDPQARSRGRPSETEENEVGAVHTMSALIDVEKKFASAESGGTRQRAVVTAVVRARDACAPSRGAGTGQGAPPWCSCARGSRESSCAGGCSVETCAS